MLICCIVLYILVEKGWEFVLGYHCLMFTGTCVVLFMPVLGPTVKFVLGIHPWKSMFCKGKLLHYLMRWFEGSLDYWIHEIHSLFLCMLGPQFTLLTIIGMFITHCCPCFLVDAARVMWFEKMYVWLRFFERNFMYPAVLLCGLTSSAKTIVETNKFGL